VSALSAQSLTARYPGQAVSRPALVDVDLDVEAGQRLLLIGPNGAGKSTFIRVFAGLMHAAHGKALIAGQPARSVRNLVGVVSHATYLYDELTAAENLRFYGQLYDVARPAERAAELLARVELTHMADVQVGRLSRGQQQRVAIARALVHDPPVLLLDEPDTGLDVAALGPLEELTTSGGRTVVLTTHNMATGLRLGTRVAVLSRGRLVHTHSSASVGDGPALVDMLEQLAHA
jgi:heme exporter protein A